MKVKNITLGCDPELFVEKNNKVVSAVGLYGGSKSHPKFISDKGHAIQEDNVAVEFNIPPSATSDDFVDNINIVLDHLHAHSKLIGLNLNFSASAMLDSSELQTEEAKTFGCDPDFNVYLKSVNDSPSSKTNLRSCGGHIHIGYDEPDVETSEKIVYAMDALLGLESLLLDDDNRRRKLYGKAGSFRFKPFGLEYRTLSNFWIKNDELKLWAYNKTMDAIELVNSGVIDEIIEKFSSRIQNAIDSFDVESAAQISEEIIKIKELKKTK